MDKLNRNSISKKIVFLFLLMLFALGVSTTAYAAGAGSTAIPLKATDRSTNVPFAVENMFPGDAAVQEFDVQINHKKPITLYYHADIRAGYEKLAEVMQVKIELPEQQEVLYDGLMRDMPNSVAYTLPAGEEHLLYRITAYLDTSVGNDYQYQELISDFRWWYLEEEQKPGYPPLFTANVKLVAEKVLDGQYPRRETFTFELRDADGNLVDTATNKWGTIEFDTLRFDEAGTYTYCLSERNDGNKKFSYDDSVYQVTITVKAVKTFGRNEIGYYASSVKYQKDGKVSWSLPRFVNHTVKDNHTPNKWPFLWFWKYWFNGNPAGTADVAATASTAAMAADITSVAADGAEQATVEPLDYPDNPKTGDDSKLLLFSALAGISLLALLILFVLGRREKGGRQV